MPAVTCQQHNTTPGDLRPRLSPVASYQSLQAAISSQTGISAAGQILLLSGQPLLEAVTAGTPVCQYPELTPLQPLVLFDKHNNDVAPCRPVPLRESGEGVADFSFGDLLISCARLSIFQQ